MHIMITQIVEPNRIYSNTSYSVVFLTVLLFMLLFCFVCLFVCLNEFIVENICLAYFSN